MDDMTRLAIHDRKVRSESGLERRRYRAGTLIFAQGKPGRSAFIIESGLVEIEKTCDDGKQLIGYVGAGEIFGEMAPIDDEPRMASARALKDTVCVVVPEAVFHDKLEHADPFVRDLLGVLVRALRAVTNRMVIREHMP